MARLKRTPYKTNTNNLKTRNSGGDATKVEFVEYRDNQNDLADSVAFEDEPYTMTSNTYDCSLSNNQVRTLSANENLIVSNAEQGRFYKLRKPAGFSITLPTGHMSNSGTSTGTGAVMITFTLENDGKLYFAFSTYSAT